MKAIDRIIFLEEKIVALQSAKKVKDYFHSEEVLVDMFSTEILEQYGNMTLGEFVALLRANVHATVKVGYINALAGIIGIPTGPDNVWCLPDAYWTPRTN